MITTTGGRGEGRSERESDELHKEAVRLYRQWAVEGHVEHRPRQGLKGDGDRLEHGRQAHDVAIEALATRVRRGERIILLCHCEPHNRVMGEWWWS